MLTLYPTDELKRQYITSKPRNSALGIAAAVLATTLLFGWYELYERRRTARVHSRLLAYVSQLETVKRALADGCTREAEAQARVLAEEASSRQKDQARRSWLVLLALLLLTSTVPPLPGSSWPW